MNSGPLTEQLAAHQVALGDGRLRCRLCPHQCAVAPGEAGVCRTRHNVGGRLLVSTYGRLLAAADDPIEKKPLFHYRPGSRTFSIASAGCNLVCPFCQNHGISQSASCALDDEPRGRVWEPAEVVRAAEASGCRSVAFTYSEPVLQFEFARDVAAAAEPTGLELVFVSNGQINERPARDLAGLIAAINIDLKTFDRAAYRDVLGGSRRAALRTIELMVLAGVWVEVTTLVIPGFNDADAELREIAAWLVGVGPEIPWHVTRFHPDHYWSDRRFTPVETIARAREIGLSEGLVHVYTGNLPGDEGEKTLCPGCGSVAIDRRGYRVLATRTAAGRCAVCDRPIAGRGLA